MKRLLNDPEIYFILGLLGFNIATLTNNLFVNTILSPVFLMMMIIGAIFTIKKYLNEKKRS